MVDVAVLRRWAAYVDDEEKTSLEAVSVDPTALEDAFSRDLTFGTGGLRGKVGIGPNRLNVWTVAKATQGLAEYLNGHFKRPTVAIAHDCRRGGGDFARVAAEVLAANGIASHSFEGVASTPELCFAVRDLSCSAGVCVTASHNPAEYNGYKVYGPDGCQITTGAAAEIQALIDAVDVFDGVRRTPFEEAASAGFARAADAGVRERYLNAAAAQLEPGIDCSGLALAYTALSGTGSVPVREMLRRVGVGRVFGVAEQAEPDSTFPTCPKPNPEEPAAMERVVALANEHGCELALATDPDADRLGVAVLLADGSLRTLTGNEVGELLLDWLLSRAEGRGEDVSRLVCCTTVVSAPRADAIARLHGCQLRRTLTGFKFIGEQVGVLEGQGEEDRFLFGLEESLGYLKGSYVRDKDGVEALGLVCQMAADFKARDMTLADALEDLGRRVGFQADAHLSRAFEGADGARRMAALMSSLRAEAPKEIAGRAVLEAVDYAAGAPMPVVNPLPTDPAQTLPPTDMVEWRLEGARVLVRPSGTEPKLKAYVFADGESEGRATCSRSEVTAGVEELLASRGARTVG